MIKTEGIVLSEMRFKDTSKILNIYTRDFGKITVMAKGAYKARSKLASSTQVFSYNEYILKKGKSFYYLNQGTIIHSFYDIRKKMERFIYGSYILELTAKSSLEGEKNQILFLLLKKSLKILSKMDKGFLKFVIAFQLKFISFIGYRPHLNNCIGCSGVLVDNIKWSNEEGGVFCNNCTPYYKNYIYIDKAIYMGIVELLYTSFEDLEAIDISTETLNFLQSLLEKYILYNIGISEFNSLKTMKTLL